MKLLHLLNLIFILFIITALLGACLGKPIDIGTDIVPTEAAVSTTDNVVSNQTPDGPTQTPTQKLTDVLGNLSYLGLFPDNQITLSDGVAFYEDGGSGHPFVRLISNLIMTGYLNGDDALDAIVILEDNSSGSGNFVFLVPVLNVLNKPKPLQALMIGDRTPVKSLTIEVDRVIVELISQGKDDPACCPTILMKKIFNLVGDNLVEQNSTEIGKVSLRELEGSKWQLIDMKNYQEPLQNDSDITLNFSNGEINGFSGCNSFSGSLTGDATFPQKFSISEFTTILKVLPYVRCTVPGSPICTASQ